MYGSILNFVHAEKLRYKSSNSLYPADVHFYKNHPCEGVINLSNKPVAQSCAAADIRETLDNQTWQTELDTVPLQKKFERFCSVHGTDHFKPMLMTSKHDYVALDTIPRSLLLNYDIILYSGDRSTMYHR